MGLESGSARYREYAVNHLHADPRGHMFKKENKNMAVYSAQNPPAASAAFVLREIEFIVRSMLPAKIAEPHLYVIGQGAKDLLSVIIHSGGPIFARRPALADLPIGHALTMSSERVAGVLTKSRPCLCREEVARRVALFQNHAAS